ncbi:MAG TPA: pepsin-like aspartic protease [Kofleriaceae bacterium]|nr:pepsin-like aspartic protease [Kofleriaceae bacterium]
MRTNALTALGAWLACGCAGRASPPPLDAGAQSGAVDLTGCLYQLAAPVTIDGQTFELVQDTGSSTLAVATASCASCADGGLAPPFSPGHATTDLQQSASAYYNGDMSFGWTAELYQAPVAIGGVVASVRLAGIDQVSGGWGNVQCGEALQVSGGLGLGTPDLLTQGTTCFVDDAVANGMPDVLALRLCQSTGNLWLGTFDPSAFAGPLQYTPMAEASGYDVTWTAALVGSGAAASQIAVPDASQLAFTDSDQLGLIVPDTMFAPITAAIEQSPAFQQDFGASWFVPTYPAAFENCIISSKTPSELDAELPPLTLRLGTSDPIDVVLDATRSYLWYTPHDSGFAYCQAIIDGAARNWGDFADLGDVLMIGHVFVIDRANQRVGIAPAPCTD